MSQRALLNKVCDPQRLLMVGVCGLLLTIPFGSAFPDFIRHCFVILMISGIIIHRFLKQNESGLHRKYRLILPFALFAASHLLSIFFSTNRSLSIEHSAYVPVAALFFFALQDVITDRRTLRLIFLILSSVLVVIVADATYQFFTGKSLISGQTTFGGRLTASTPHPNDIALVPILLPFVLALMVSRRFLLPFILLPLIAITLIGSQSRNAWIGFVAAMTVWLLLTQCSWRTVLTLFCLVTMLVSIAFATNIGRFRERVDSIAHLRHDGRVALYLVAWRMFMESPLTGKGVHVYGDYYPMYLDRVTMPEGYKPEVAPIPWAHDLYLEILAERGILGFLAFMFLVAALLTALRQSLRQSTSSRDRIHVSALAASLAAFLAMSVFDLTFLKDWVILVFFILAGLIAKIPDLISDEVRSDLDPL